MAPVAPPLATSLCCPSPNTAAPTLNVLPLSARPVATLVYVSPTPNQVACHPQRSAPLQYGPSCYTRRISPECPIHCQTL